MQDEFLVVELDGMARVIAALITDNDIAFPREKIDDLPLAFIAPLSPNQNAVHNFTTFTSITSLFFLISATTLAGTSLSVLIAVMA